MREHPITTRLRSIPRVFYNFAEHITEPLPPWHENPVLKLAWDIERMDMADCITVAGKLVRKRWNKHTGTRYVVCEADGRHIKACKSAMEASKRVYEVENGQPAEKQRTPGNS